ncbi:FkbM family methyltransferase [Dysgonomonadaceae bacterium PH5-43]|nr:FkbM family methyltransferase [Dysgonomonadaceae bacterium PH5-43]
MGIVSSVKRFVYRNAGMKNYLRLMQKGYFFAYNLGMLKNNPDYSYHYFVKSLIKEDDVIVDIGANLGYYSILFAKWAPSGKVYSVEPIKIYNEIFNEKAKKYSNITLYPYALGTEEKVVELVSSPQSGYLNTGLPHVYNPDKDGKLEEQEFRFEVEMKVASKLFGNLEKLDYIKCDIEGFEYFVLSDMKEIINKHKPKVQVEVWGEHQKELFDLFYELGYKPYKLINGKLELQDRENITIGGDFIFSQDN